MEGLMDDFEIREYDSRYKDQLLDVQVHHWGSDRARNAAYFEWKFEQNPYMAIPSIFLGLKDGQVVGMLGMFGSRWEFGTDRRSAMIPCPSDAVVEPEHRRQGLFHRLFLAQFQHLADQGFRHSIALSVGNMSFSGLLSLGWKSIGAIQTMRKQEQQTLKSPLQKLRTALRLPGIQKKPFSSLDQCPGGRGIMIQKTPRPEQMTLLVERLGYDGRIRHVRDSEYFTWRFRNPFSQYRFLFSGTDPLDGYLVLQAAYDSCKSSATIVDWEGSTFDIRVKLLQAALEWGRFENVFAWSAMLSKEVKAVLRDLGFQWVGEKQKNRDRPVMVRPLQNLDQEENWRLNHHPLTESSSWDLRWLYSDHCW
jgi:GNAT superfamily N-acetyltransferase